MKTSALAKYFYQSWHIHIIVKGNGMVSVYISTFFFMWNRYKKYNDFTNLTWGELGFFLPPKIFPHLWHYNLHPFYYLPFHIFLLVDHFCHLSDSQGYSTFFHEVMSGSDNTWKITQLTNDCVHLHTVTLGVVGFIYIHHQHQPLQVHYKTKIFHQISHHSLFDLNLPCSSKCSNFITSFSVHPDFNMFLEYLYNRNSFTEINTFCDIWVLHQQ